MSRQRLALYLTAAFGTATLLGLLLAPSLAAILLGWGAFLAAVALLFGGANLFLVHGRRLLREGNVYSFFLLIAFIGTLLVAAADGQGLLQGGLQTVFDTLLRPLEAALASLLAFFLLFAGFRMFARRPGRWTWLFLASAVVVLLGSVPTPVNALAAVGELFGWLRDLIGLIFVTAGMRGILLGLALGTIVLSIRLLVGWERPFEQ